jgi:hypothetical protein
MFRDVILTVGIHGNLKKLKMLQGMLMLSSLLEVLTILKKVRHMVKEMD